MFFGDGFGPLWNVFCVCFVLLFIFRTLFALLILDMGSKSSVQRACSARAMQGFPLGLKLGGFW